MRQRVSSFFLFLLLSQLLGSTLGRLLVVAVVLWYLDDRYFGLLASLWAPVMRRQRIASLRSSVAINPADVRSLVELGDHYLHMGRPRLAAEYLEQAAQRGEDGARFLYLLGAAWIQLGRHAEGRAKLEAALAAQPSMAFGEPYLYLLEETLATEGGSSPRVAELVAHLDDFDSVEVLTRGGWLCARAGRKDLARSLFAEAVRNYGFVPKKMRRRERRWLVRARLGLLMGG